MKKNFRIFSAVLTVCMLFTLLPLAAFAEEGAEHTHAYKETILQEPTCEKTGVKKLTCDCGDFKYEIIPVHKFNDGEVTTPATCGKAGVKTFTCTGGCGTTYTEVIPATGNHNFEDTVADATCTEPSKAGEICTVCGAVNGKITELGDPLGHDFQLDTDAEGYKAATCTEAGVNTMKCSRCEATKTEATPATGHSYNDGVVVESCEGQYVLRTCQKCSATTKELTGLGEVKEHTWVEDSRTAATCTDKGSIAYTCSACSQTKTEEIAALGHDVVDTVVAPTCKAEGYTKHECSRCDYKTDNTNITPVNPNAHVAGDSEVLKPATCTVAGVKKNACKLCGASMGYTSIDPAHSWDDGEETTPATCTEAGVKTFECSACNETRTEAIPAAHKWDAGTETTPATCGKAGVKTYTCSACSETRTEAIPATNAHNYEDTVVDATCTAPSMAGEICTVCGAAKGELHVVEGSNPLGHDFQLDTSLEGYKAATCTEAGVDTMKCSRCEATENRTTPATGHSWNEGTLVEDCAGQHVLYECDNCDETYKELTGIGGVKEHTWEKDSETAATCTDKGSAAYTCSACGQKKTEEIAALGHDVVDTVVAPTCKAEGYTKHECSRCDYKTDNTNITPVNPNAHEAGEGTVLKEATCTVAGVKKNACKLCGASMGYTSIDPAHSWDDGEETTPATCTEAGVKTYTCSACNETRTEAIPAAHKWDAGTETTPATCGKAGVKTYTCSACNETKTEAIPATNAHNYEDAVVDATCTAPSMAGEICTVCKAAKGELHVVDGSNPLGHDFVLDTDAEGYKAATCTEAGVDTYKCSRCEATKTEATPATGHSWNNGKLVDDCAGQHVLYECDNCDATYKELTGLGEVKEHTWVEDSRTAATCTDKGSIAYTCSACGQKKTEEIAALGHDVVDTVVAPTCQAEGYTSHKCSRCDYTEENSDTTPVNPNAHVAGDGTILKPATCTVAGVKKNACKLCGASMGYVAIDPAHSWNDGEETTPATCTEAGVKTFTCTECSATKTEAIPANGHSWNDGEETTPATCGKAGVKTFTCTACSATRTEAIPATNEHSFADDQIVEATCTEPMKVGRLCTVCGAADGEFTVMGDPLGHDFVLDTSLEGYKAATCTEAGVDTYKCSRCEATKTEATQATGHNWDNGEIKAADCEHAQYALYKCTECDATKTEETGLEAALGHDMKATTVAATCSAQGYTTHKCTRCGKETEKTDITEIDANAHTYDYDNAVILREATCAKPGVIRVTCTGCNKSVYQENIVEHAWDESSIEVTKAPTCTEKGVATISCSNCEATKTEDIEALGHKYGEEKVDDDNTYVYVECSVCHHQKIIASLVDDCEHTTELQNAIDATCTEDGYTGDQVCTKCEEVIEAGTVIPATGHTEEVLPGKDATCTEDGLTEGKICTTCETVTVAQEAIPATGHTEEVLSGKDATCTEDGLTEGKACATCGTVTVAQETIPATGHDYVFTGTSYNEDYSMCWHTYTCSHCGHSYNTEATES